MAWCVAVTGLRTVQIESLQNLLVQLSSLLTVWIAERLETFSKACGRLPQPWWATTDGISFLKAREISLSGSGCFHTGCGRECWPGHREIRGSDATISCLPWLRSLACEGLTCNKLSAASDTYFWKRNQVCAPTHSQRRRRCWRCCLALKPCSRAHLGLMSGINYRIQQRLT